MTSQITFKEYLKSKNQLREAIKQTPKQLIEYTVNKYCKIPVGESRSNREHILLKPKHSISVEWLYEDVSNPIVLSIRFNNLESVDADGVFNPLWDSTKITSWLKSNTREMFKL